MVEEKSIIEAENRQEGEEAAAVNWWAVHCLFEEIGNGIIPIYKLATRIAGPWGPDLGHNADLAYLLWDAVLKYAEHAQETLDEAIDALQDHTGREPWQSFLEAIQTAIYSVRLVDQNELPGKYGERSGVAFHMMVQPFTEAYQAVKAAMDQTKRLHNGEAEPEAEDLPACSFNCLPGHEPTTATA